MSGTSLDGIDVVAVSFDSSLQLIAADSFDMPLLIKQQILELCSTSDDEIEKLGHLDRALGLLFAQCCNRLIEQYKESFSRNDIVAIGLHGQTIRHRPANTPKHNFTLQIGDANTVAEQTGILTIADFRKRDIAAAGQGAPLVPAFHQAIFQSSKQSRVILNIGGMANVTLLHKRSQTPLLGFDTGPGNVLMDSWIMHQQQRNYDDNGSWAKQGIVDQNLLDQLLSLDFFSQTIPKSTGREQFNLAWIENSLEKLNFTPSSVDIQRTLLELSAVTITNEIKKQDFAMAQLFVCGGGAHNKLLMQRLEQLLPQATLVTSTAQLDLDPDWVEATAFAWLAKQTLAGLSGNSPTVTGATGERILGAIFQA
ncbi:MAG: anhydro-N-acetylmuramic acid kinase [Oceanospirillaceae bacterium]|jgi:anhydro-N-acetylmuramic acid kinase